MARVGETSNLDVGGDLCKVARRWSIPEERDVIKGVNSRRRVETAPRAIMRFKSKPLPNSSNCRSSSSREKVVE